MPEERYLAFPLDEDAAGAPATVALAEHVEQLVEQLLFTAPGERVNRPTLGCGLMQLVFDPLSDELRSATQFLVRSSLQEWLQGIVAVEDVRIGVDGAQLDIDVTYRVTTTGERLVAGFRR